MFTMIFIAAFIIANTVHAEDKMLISDVDIIVLNNAEMTSGRRAPPVPQLECLRNCYNTPSEVTCTNNGKSDNGDPIWDCKADLPSSVHFATMNVQCEGYDYPDDPYILKNSCGLSYSLSSRSFNKSNPSTKDREPSPMGGIILLMMIVLALSSCSDSSSSYSSGSSRPGFWTGAAVGAMGASSYNRRRSGWGSGSSGFSTSRGFARTSRR